MKISPGSKPIEEGNKVFMLKEACMNSNSHPMFGLVGSLK